MDKAKTGSYIKEKRLAAGMTESALAEKLGVDAHEIACWEGGFFSDVQYLLPLSEALGTTVEELLRGEDAPPEPGKCGEKEAPPTAPAPTKEKSYYESLRETIRYTDENGKPYTAELNGFSPNERKFGYIVCAAFVILVLLVNIGYGLVYLGLGRRLTSENYRQYLRIYIGWDSEAQLYDLTVTAQRDIVDFDIELQITLEAFTYPYEEDEPPFQTAVSLSQETFGKGKQLSKEITCDPKYYGDISPEYTITRISGGIK